jgi:PrtD family type I secretion system ABC transporter
VLTSTRLGAPRPELRDFLSSYRSAFWGIGVISALVSVLTLNGTIFMLEIYDRVLPSRSVPTLVGLGIIAAGLFVMQGALEYARSRLLGGIGASLDEAFGARIYKAILRLPLLRGGGPDAMQPLRDLDQVRSFLGGSGPTALFDLPWMPLYLVISFLFHPWIGITALVGAILLTSLTLAADILTRAPEKSASAAMAARNGMADAARRNAESVRAMGMENRLAARWSEVHLTGLQANLRAAAVGGALSALSRTLRVMLQSAILGVGAYLAIHQEVSAGSIIACSVLMARSLAPVELAIANWKGFIQARQSWARLNALLLHLPESEQPLPLPAPSRTLAVETASVATPREGRVVVQDITFRLAAGQAIGIIGPSASGKSSLARALTGVWPLARGRVQIDGADLQQWANEALGVHIGYLPQNVELFDGTVAENIARFDPASTPDGIIAAARAAGVHDLVVDLPQGYDTSIGDGGSSLSAGQRQRIGLARALYGNPFLVVLDEPNSNLDHAGDEALTAAIMDVRARGGIAVVIAHRPAALAAVDRMLVMRDGKMVSIGGRDEILAAFLRQVASGAVPPGAAGSPFTATAGPPPAGAGAKPARSADKPIVEARFG